MEKLNDYCKNNEDENSAFEVTFRINGRKVIETEFNELLIKVRNLKEYGVVSYIDFEVSYEMK